jgi:hypothetical protein
LNGCIDITPPLPQNIDAERSLLGAVLLDNSVLSRVRPTLTAEAFFLPEHQAIFRVMCTIADSRRPIDTVLVMDSLAELEELERVGGAAYLSQLADGLPRVNNVEHYAEIVRTKAEARRRLYQFNYFSEKLLRANGNLREVLNEINREIESSIAPSIEADLSRFRFRNAAEPSESPDIRWLVRGLVPVGAIVSINAKIKLGKTAFVLALCRAIITGDHFLGQQTTKTNVVYLTEQTASSFDHALRVADLRGIGGFTYLPFTETCGSPWPKVAEQALLHCDRTESGLLVVDTLSQFAGIVGDSENDAGAALAAMLPLQKVAAAGVAVIMIRHARKSGGDVEDAGRGSSAFDGAADLILSIRRPDGNQSSNRRLLTSSGRYSGETLNNLLIEMAGFRFVAIGSQQEMAQNDAEARILAQAPRSKLEAVSLRKLGEGIGIPRGSLQRLVSALVRKGRIKRAGKGKRASPFVHWVEENQFNSTPTIGVEVDSIPAKSPGAGDEQVGGGAVD